MSEPDHTDDEGDELARLALANARRQASFWALFANARVFVPKAVIWLVFFALLAMLRDFFALIFTTFVLSFLSVSATRWLERVLPRAGWKTRSSLVFTVSLLGLGVFAWQLLPQAEEGVELLHQAVLELPDRWVHEIDPWLYENVGPYRGLVDEPLPEGVVDGEPTRRALWEVERVRETLREWAEHALGLAPALLAQLVTGAGALVSLAFLSVLFAFLIVLDLQALTAEVRRLEQTRLHGFYRETARDIVVFGSVLGKVLEAQAVISAVNTLLTAVGLWWLDLPHIGFLSLLVFLCGFIPVAGVFLSSVPIGLVALVVGGPGTLVWFVLFVTLVHMLEAYVLNPRIMGARLKINPVLVLVILVLGHHALGGWGLLLGLPICYYFFTHVIKREPGVIGLAARYRPDSNAGDAGASS